MRDRKLPPRIAQNAPHIVAQAHNVRSLHHYDLEREASDTLVQHGASSIPATGQLRFGVSRSHKEHLLSGGMAERKSRDGKRQRNGAQTYRPGHATCVEENSPDNCKHGEDTQSNDQSSRQLIYRIYTSNPALNLLFWCFDIEE